MITCGSKTSSTTISGQGILRLMLNDSDRRNALSEEMLAALADAFDQASDNPDVRVIILAAAGPVFCSGHDLKQMSAARQNADRGHAYFTKILDQCSFLLCKKLSQVRNR